MVSFFDQNAKLRAAMLGFENPVGPVQNQYTRNNPGQDQNGYLQPTQSNQKRSSLLARLSLVSTGSSMFNLIF